MPLARPTIRRSQREYIVTASGGGLPRSESAGKFLAFDAKDACQRAHLMWMHENRAFPEYRERTDYPDLKAVPA